MTGVTEQQDWGRVAKAVRDRREHLGLRREDMKASPSTVYKLETAAQDSYKTFSLRQVEADLHWELGSIDRLLNGEEPIESSTVELAGTSTLPPFTSRGEMTVDNSTTAAALDARVSRLEALMQEVLDLVRQLPDT